MYRTLADLALVTHAAFVAFVVFGLLLTVLGALRGWRWIRHRGFRVVHLACIAFVVVQSWFGLTCPLTSLENSLRVRAGQVAYGGGFIEGWLHRVLFFRAEPWVFAVAYSVFGAGVLGTWWLAPPRRMPPG